MKQNILKTILGGIFGTILLTLMALFVAPMMGVKMDPPAMLAMKFHVSMPLGWLMHFMMGIMFAFFYLVIVRILVGKVTNVWVKGLIFGAVVFVIAAVGMSVMGAMVPSIMGLMALLMAHLVYGMGVVRTINE